MLSTFEKSMAQERFIEHRGVLFPGQAEGLNPREKTIASVLKEGGYTTKMIGKWHVGDQPEFLPAHYGFDSWFGIPYSNDMGLQTRSPKKAWAQHIKVPLPLVRDSVQWYRNSPIRPLLLKDTPKRL